MKPLRTLFLTLISLPMMLLLSACGGNVSSDEDLAPVPEEALSATGR